MTFAEKVKGALVLIGFLFLLGIVGGIETHYTVYGTVQYSFDKTVGVCDEWGELWECEGKTFKTGDKVKMKMFTNYTDNTRYDDELVGLKHVYPKD